LTERKLGLPGIYASTKAVLQVNNSALGYGDYLATYPLETFVVDSGLAKMIPGIDVLNASLVMKDALGQIVKGTAEVTMPYILESWSCPQSACATKQSQNPHFYIPFDSVSGIGSTFPSNRTIACAIGDPSVTIFFNLYGAHTQSLPVAPSSIDVLCAACDAMQVRTQVQGSNGTAKWQCSPCRAGQYIIDPNQDVCQNCPLGNLDLFLPAQVIVNQF
jgi:hypothetical protein